MRFCIGMDIYQGQLNLGLQLYASTGSWSNQCFNISCIQNSVRKIKEISQILLESISCHAAQDSREIRGYFELLIAYYLAK